MDNSLGLRFAASLDAIDKQTYEAALDYVSPVPLFDSGAEAAAHGLAEIDEPGEKAIKVITKLGRRLDQLPR